MRYIASGATWSDEAIRDFVERQIGCAAQRGFCLWALEEKESGAVIGHCGLQPFAPLAEIEIGWWLARERWGRGLAAEAARRALDFGFGEAKLARVIALVHPGNAASLGVLRKLGMTVVRRTTRGALGLPHPEIPLLIAERARDAGAPDGVA